MPYAPSNHTGDSAAVGNSEAGFFFFSGADDHLLGDFWVERFVGATRLDSRSPIARLNRRRVNPSRTLMRRIAVEIGALALSVC